MSGETEGPHVGAQDNADQKKIILKSGNSEE